MFFKSAYELIVSYYDTIKKQNKELPNEEIHYDPEYIPKNQTIDAEINKINKTDFNKRFNDIFENKITVKDDESKLQWFREENEDKYGEIKNEKDIHNSFEKMRNNKKGLVVYNGEFQPLFGSSRGIGANSFYDEPETDENGYITCNPFDKLKYDDISRVHRDQVIIPVQNSEFIRANKPRTLDEYKRAPDITMIEKGKALEMLDIQTQNRNNAIMEKHHNMQKKTSTYEQMNGAILSQFMLLR
jgi:hypothetical protein